MRIFTSWSGDRSKAAALGLKTLLEQLFPETVQVFVSEHISPGERWQERIESELEQSEFGILCLTRDNWESPWLLFEAGAIAKRFTSTQVSRVVPYLIDDLPPAAERSPLAQFQRVRADREGTYRLIEAINNARQNPRPSDKLKDAFHKVWWVDLEETLKTLQASSPLQPVARSDRELLETILQRVETLSRAGHASQVDLPPMELTHLRNLRDQPDLAYKRDSNLQKELRHLRDLGLIKNRKPIADLPASFELGQHFDLTAKGRDHLKNVAPTPGEQEGQH